MQLLSTVVSLALCLPTLVNAFANSSQEFHLKTRLLKPRYRRHQFDDLYVYSYHTGAGLSDACLDTKILDNGNGIAFLNETGGNVIFNLSEDFPWGLNLQYTTSYNQWSSVTIDGGEGTFLPFFFNASGLTSKSDEFDGWMVCDWSHGVPQLFFRYPSGNNLPRSCANVELIPEYI